MTATLDEKVETPPTSRVYTVGVTAVVSLHLVLWLVIVAGGWLYWDDFILQGQAARLGLSADLLLNNHDGHVMPATYAVVWMIQEIAGLNYFLVAATMLLGEVAMLAAAVLAFTTLLGRGFQTVVALAVYLLCPIMFPGLTWWAEALMITPMLTCALFATVAHVRYLLSGSLAALLTTFGLVTAALAFFEKSLVIVVWLFLVTVLVDPRRGVWASVRSTIVSHWRLWGAWTAFVLMYLLGFAQVAEEQVQLPNEPGKVLAMLGRAMVLTIAPALVGGPLRWTPVDYSASFADPLLWVVVVGVAVTATVVFLGVRRPGLPRKAWVVAAVALAVELALFSVGRLGEGGETWIVQAGRYVVAAMLPISIAIGTTLAAEQLRLRQPHLRWPLVAAVSAMSLMMVLSVLSYAAIWSKNPAQRWVGNARTDLAAADPQVPLLDQEVPDFLLQPFTHPYNQTSWFLAPVREQPGFATSTDKLQVIDNRGRLVPAVVDGVAARPSTQDCDVVEAGGALTLPLRRPIMDWTHTVQLDYRAAGPGFITVTIGSGQPVTADVETGEHSVFVRAAGGGPSVTVTSSDTAVCISSAEVGKVVPKDLNYGGEDDWTDELQRLG